LGYQRAGGQIDGEKHPDIPIYLAAIETTQRTRYTARVGARAIVGLGRVNAVTSVSDRF
jgi:hypothetical protein